MSDEASSLITINEATVQELQVLSHIGPKRAERIVSYRQNVEPIGSERMLAIASGLGKNQIKSLCSSIDWRKPKTSIKDKVVPIFIYVLLIVGIISRLPEFSFSDLTSSTFNSMVSLMIAGLAILLSSILVEAGFSKPILESRLRLVGYLMLSTTLIGFGLLLIKSSLRGQSPPHLLQVIQFIGWASIILLIILGPALHVWLISKNGDVASKSVNAQIRAYQLTTLPLIVACSIYLLFTPTVYDTTMIFYIWLSAICFWIGNEVRNGKSFYLSLLSDLDERRLELLLDLHKLNILPSRKYALAYFFFGFLLIASVIVKKLF